jgi:hypothetical protein
MTGKHVTTSSRSAIDSNRNVVPRRNTSIHTEVSTSSTSTRPLALARRPITPHRWQITFPEARPGQLEDPTCFDSPDKVLERALDSAGVRPLAAQLDGFLEERTVDHKICTFHVY